MLCSWNDNNLCPIHIICMHKKTNTFIFLIALPPHTHTPSTLHTHSLFLFSSSLFVILWAYSTAVLPPRTLSLWCRLQKESPHKNSIWADLATLMLVRTFFAIAHDRWDSFWPRQKNSLRESENNLAVWRKNSSDHERSKKNPKEHQNCWISSNARVDGFTGCCLFWGPGGNRRETNGFLLGWTTKQWHHIIMARPDNVLSATL